MLQQRRAEDTAAIENSKALVEEMDRTDPEVDQLHRVALERLEESTQQAQRLKAADRRNHYSESLTHAFRGSAA